MRQTEDDLQLVHCEPAQPDGNCCILSDMCKLRGVLSTALDAFMNVLDSTTLADLLPDHERAHLLTRLPGPAQEQQTQQPLAKSA